MKDYSPGPVYNPGTIQTTKGVPISHHMAGRHNFGSHLEFELSVISPGPCYNPDEVAMKYMNTARQHTFGPPPWLVSEEQAQLDEERKLAAQENRMSKYSSVQSGVYGKGNPYANSQTAAMKGKIWKKVRGGGKRKGPKPRFRHLEYY